MSESRYALQAAAAFGLEALVRDELAGLGMTVTETRDRRVLFEGTALDIARCNVRLRTADRVWLQVSDFPAVDFDQLYEGVRRAPWTDILPRDARVVLKARSAGSRLSAVPSLQSVSKKAVMDALLGTRGGHGATRLPETGPEYVVEVSLQRDHATVCVDTTGPGLHKRGYRAETGAAPLRENLAAALVLLSRWDPSRPFADPLCGSGTIAIEAALIGRGAAPGVNRSFAAESWPALPRNIWQEAREEARAREQPGAEVDIEASDKDPALVEAARRNAARAGVKDCVRVRCAPLATFRPARDHGCLVCNPPYGERLGERRDVEAVARELGELHRRLSTWSFFVLSAAGDFPRLFGSPFSKNRKLYNGSIRCYLYQWYGPLPPRGA